MTSSSLHKNQLVDKNLPFLINDNACTVPGPSLRFGFVLDQIWVSDLVLLRTKSESQYWIWFCLESNLSLGLGFGIGLGLFSVPDLVLV